MIPFISAAQTAAMPAERGAQPSLPQGSVMGFAGSAASEALGGQFLADMRRAAGETGLTPEMPVELAALTVAPEETGAPKRGETQNERNLEDEQSLSPEQWLLAMLGQQQTDIQARDERTLNALAPEESEPEQQAITQAVDDAVLAWAPDVDPPVKQAGTADAVLGKAEQDQRVSRFAELTDRTPSRAMEMGKGLATDLPRSPTPTLLDPVVESLRPTAEQVEAGDPLLAADRGQAPQVISADRGLKLQGPEARWGEQMLHALRENVDLQVQQKVQSATIRLDPPELGSMEILLSHESGRLNVQLTAANFDVARLLQQTSDRLRQELVGQHFVQVNVQVGAEGGGQQGQQRQRALLTGDEPPMAARAEAQAERPDNTRARDVLVTV